MTSPPQSPQGGGPTGPYGYGTGPYTAPPAGAPYGQDPYAPPPQTQPQAAAAAVPVEVRDYLSWLERREEGWTEDHAWVSTGLRRLASAIESLNAKMPGSIPGFEADVAQLRGAAERLRTPESQAPELRHAQIAKDALRAATDLVDRLAARQQVSGADLSTEIRDMRSAVAAIDGARPLLEQESAFRRFFDAAADPLEALGRR